MPNFVAKYPNMINPNKSKTALIMYHLNMVCTYAPSPALPETARPKYTEEWHLPLQPLHIFMNTPKYVPLGIDVIIGTLKFMSAHCPSPNGIAQRSRPLTHIHKGIATQKPFQPIDIYMGRLYLLSPYIFSFN